MKGKKTTASFYWYDSLLLSCIGIIAFLILVGNFLAPHSVFDEHRQQVLLSPHSPFAHLALAEDFQKNNQTALTKNELALMATLRSEDTLLLQDSIKRLARLTEGREMLLGINSQLLNDRLLFPNYRDLSLQQAIINWQLKKDSEAHRYFSEALYLDPNYDKVKQVGQLLLLTKEN